MDTSSSLEIPTMNRFTDSLSDVDTSSNNFSKYIIPALVVLGIVILLRMMTKKSSSSPLDCNSCGEKSSDNTLHFYYAPWCGWSKKMFPIWEDLKKEVKKKNINVKLNGIDCTKKENKGKCSNVRGYPTLKFNGKEFRGKRDVESLLKFIQ